MHDSDGAPPRSPRLDHARYLALVGLIAAGTVCGPAASKPAGPAPAPAKKAPAGEAKAPTADSAGAGDKPKGAVGASGDDGDDGAPAPTEEL